MWNRIKLPLFAVCLGVIAFACARIAHADPPTLPPDPLREPGAAFDSFKALTKIGWPITVIAAVAVLARLLSRIGPRFAFLAGKPAAVIAIVAAVAASAFDVLALGGSWASVVLAAATSLLTIWNPAGKPDKGGN